MVTCRRYREHRWHTTGVPWKARCTYDVHVLVVAQDPRYNLFVFELYSLLSTTDDMRPLCDTCTAPFGRAKRRQICAARVNLLSHL